MIVLVPIETSRRELLYKTYLCQKLASRGFTCYLGNKSNINYLLNKFTNYIYLDKGYHQGKSDNIYNLVKSQKGYIVSLDEEGAVDFSDNRTLLKRYSKELFAQADLVFLWGEKQKEIINFSKPVYSKVVVSGHPRFELLKPEYQLFYQEESDRIKDKYNKFILFNTNMGFGNNIKGDEFVREGYGKWYQEIEEIMEYDHIKLEAYIDFIKLLSSSYDGNIIIRPHPEEDISTYKNELSTYKNVSIINKGSVVPWIIASEWMIHPDCTTSIESFFLGNKPISFLPKSENKSHITKLPLLISSCIESFEEFDEAINNNQIDSSNLKVINDYFSFDKNSTDIIVNEIDNLVRDIDRQGNQYLSLKDKLYLYLKGLKSKWSTKESMKLQRNKLSGLDNHHITKIHEQSKTIDDNFNQVKLTKLADQLFQFNSNNIK